MTSKKKGTRKNPSPITTFSIIWTQVGDHVCVATQGPSAAIFDSNANAARYFREVADSIDRGSSGKEAQRGE